MTANAALSTKTRRHLAVTRNKPRRLLTIRPGARGEYIVAPGLVFSKGQHMLPS